MAVGVFGVTFLDMAAVAKDDVAELQRRMGADDMLAEPFLDQLRQVAGVVEVGVGEDDGAQTVRVDRERRPVLLAQRLLTLEEAAIHQDRASVVLEQVFRTRDGAGAAEAGKMEHGESLCKAAAAEATARSVWTPPCRRDYASGAGRLS